MKTNEKIKTDLIINLEARLTRLEEWISLYLDEMKQAETVEEIMRIKREMLLAWLTFLPLRAENCYFALSIPMIVSDVDTKTSTENVASQIHISTGLLEL